VGGQGRGGPRARRDRTSSKLGGKGGEKWNQKKAGEKKEKALTFKEQGRGTPPERKHLGQQKRGGGGGGKREGNRTKRGREISPQKGERVPQEGRKLAQRSRGKGKRGLN